MAAKKEIVIFDLDRTITRRGTFSPFLFGCCQSKRTSMIGIPLVLFHMLRYKRGFISRGALKEKMLSIMLAGRSRKQIAKASAKFAQHILKKSAKPMALATIHDHKAMGRTLVLATASMDFYATDIAAALGFDHVVSTRSCWDEQDRMLPKIDGENCYGKEKLVKVQKLLKQLKLKRDDVYIRAYSDHHTDLSLLKWADEGFAVDPSPELAAAVDRNGLYHLLWGKTKPLPGHGPVGQKVPQSAE